MEHNVFTIQSCIVYDLFAPEAPHDQQLTVAVNTAILIKAHLANKVCVAVIFISAQHYTTRTRFRTITMLV